MNHNELVKRSCRTCADREVCEDADSNIEQEAHSPDVMLFCTRWRDQVKRKIAVRGMEDDE